MASLNTMVKRCEGLVGTKDVSSLPNTVVIVLLMLTDFGIWMHNLKMLLAA